MEGSVFLVCEFFSGIGGWKQALRNSGKDLQNVAIQAFDINTVCNDVYKHNYGKAPCPRTIEALQTADVTADMWVMSPPCQPHTRNNQTDTRDTQDPRSQSFLHLIELLRTMTEPPAYVALENVVGFETSDCCALWREVMRERGYSMLEFHLTPTQFGIPNERPRYFSLSIRGEFANGAHGVAGEILNSIPGVQEVLPAQLGDFVMPQTAEDQQSLLVTGEVLAKQASWCIDIATVEDTSTSCFTKSYSRFFRGTGSVLLIPNDEHLTTEAAVEHSNAEGKTAEDSKQEHATDHLKRPAADATSSQPCRKKRELLEDPSTRQFDPTWHKKYEGRLRYFSPRELLNLFGFDEQFSFPSSCARKKQYEMIGNSLNAVVASKLLRFLFDTEHLI